MITSHLIPISLSLVLSCMAALKLINIVFFGKIFCGTISAFHIFLIASAVDKIKTFACPFLDLSTSRNASIVGYVLPLPGL